MTPRCTFPPADEIGADVPEVPQGDLPSDTLLYTLPSRYCLSDQLTNTAWSLFGSLPPGWSPVQAVCDWVHQEVAFGYGSTSPDKTAVDVLETRTGVCRDFTHLAITFCRALNIPARYVFGYLPRHRRPAASGSPWISAAWMQVWLGERWWTFDPPQQPGPQRPGGDRVHRPRPTWPWSPATAAPGSTVWRCGPTGSTTSPR